MTIQILDSKILFKNVEIALSWFLGLGKRINQKEEKNYNVLSIVPAVHKNLRIFECRKVLPVK